MALIAVGTLGEYGSVRHAISRNNHHRNHRAPAIQSGVILRSCNPVRHVRKGYFIRAQTVVVLEIQGKGESV